MPAHRYPYGAHLAVLGLLTLVLSPLPASPQGQASAYPDVNATDGDPLTYWSSPPRTTMQEEFIVLDLGSEVAIGRVRLLSRADDASLFPPSFEIQVSTDGVAFTTAHVEANFTATAATWYGFELTPPAPGRYVRVVATRANQRADGLFLVQIAEIKLDVAVAPAPTALAEASSTSLQASVGETEAGAALAENVDVMLSWTASGDNGTQGTAAAYEIRYSNDVITDVNFTLATLVSGVPAPAPAGQLQNHTLELPRNNYYFAMVAIDEAGNRSALSNVAALLIACESNCAVQVTSKLAWDASPSTIAAYRVYVSLQSGVYDFDSPVASIPAAASREWPLADGSLATGVRYYAVVTAADGDGQQSAPSNEISFIIAEVVSSSD